MNEMAGDGKRPIDWGEIHQRLESARLALESGAAVSQAQKAKILKERAAILAAEPVGSKEDALAIEVIEFLLAYERYGIESRFVREVYPLRHYTPLPGTPPFVLGVINVRSRILSVIDIKKFFDLPEKGLTDLNKVIIVRSGDMEVGLLADAIIGAREVMTDEMQSELPTLTVRAEFLKGVTGERLIVLDIESILSDKRIVVHEEVEE